MTWKTFVKGKPTNCQLINMKKMINTAKDWKFKTQQAIARPR